ncbi:MAG: biotin attachment protein [Candidatus Saccharimonas sp.]|nr:biotin attachment protein [Planctomycetaceae bacterium]
MRVSLTLPDLGVGDETVRVSGWLVDRGDLVIEGDRVVEVLISGVTFDVEATHSGLLIEITKSVDTTVSRGDILGWLNSADDEPPDPELHDPSV